MFWSAARLFFRRHFIKKCLRVLFLRQTWTNIFWTLLHIFSTHSRYFLIFKDSNTTSPSAASPRCPTTVQLPGHPSPPPSAPSHPSPPPFASLLASKIIQSEVCSSWLSLVEVEYVYVYGSLIDLPIFVDFMATELVLSSDNITNNHNIVKCFLSSVQFPTSIQL